MAVVGIVTAALIFLAGAVGLVRMVLEDVARRRGADGGDGSDGSSSDGGDGGSRRPDPAPHRGGGDGADPPWWPQFERDFAAHVSALRGRELTGAR